MFLKGGLHPSAHYDYFVPFGVIENRFTKIKFKYFNGNCDYSSCQVDEFYFYMYYPIKAWLFEKTIFELVYLFHKVL